MQAFGVWGSCWSLPTTLSDQTADSLALGVWASRFAVFPKLHSKFPPVEHSSMTVSPGSKSAGVHSHGISAYRVEAHSMICIHIYIYTCMYIYTHS